MWRHGEMGDIHHSVSKEEDAHIQVFKVKAVIRAVLGIDNATKTVAVASGAHSTYRP